MAGNLGSLGTLFVDVESNSAQFHKDMGGVNKRLRGFERDVNASLIKTGKALVGVSAGISLGLIASLKKFADFEQTMANVASVSGATADEFDTLSQHAQTLGESTVFTAQEAGEAMYYLASAGLEVGEQIEATGTILDLASATQSTLAETTQLTVAALKQFQIPTKAAGRVTNVFAAVISKSQATLGKLAVSMPYVGATFNALGYSVEDAAGALGILYDRGLEASMAGTRLRGALNTLLKPTGAATEAMEAMGISIADVNPETNSLVEIVREFETAGMTASDAAKIFGARAEGMTLLVAAGADALTDMTEEITGTDRAAEMAGRQLDTVTGDLKLLKSAAEGAAINIGTNLAEGFRDLTQDVTALIDKFNKLDPEWQNIITKGAGVTAALTGISGVSLILIGSLPKIAAGFAMVAPAAAALASVALGPVGIAIGAVAVSIGAAAGAIALYKDAKKDVFFENEFKVVQGNIEGVEKAVKNYADGIESLEKHMDNLVKQGVDPFTESIDLAELGVEGLGEAVLPIPEQMERLKDRLHDTSVELLETGGVTKDHAEAMVSAAEATDEAAKKSELLNNAIVDAPQYMKDFAASLKEVTGEAKGLGDELAAIELPAIEWTDIQDEWADLTAITGERYEAGTLAAIAFYEAVREQGGLTVEAERGVTNTIGDLYEELYDTKKMSFLNLVPDLVPDKEDTIERAKAIFGDIETLHGKHKTDIALAERQAATDRIDAEVDINEAMAEKYDGFVQDRIGQIEIGADDIALAQMTADDASAIAAGLSYDELLLTQDTYIEDTLTLLGKWKKDAAELVEKSYTDQALETIAGWEGKVDAVTDGVENLGEAYKGLYELWHDRSMTDEEYQGKALVRLGLWFNDQGEELKGYTTGLTTWIDKQKTLWNDMKTIWGDARKAYGLLDKALDWASGGEGGGSGGETAASLAGTAAGTAAGSGGETAASLAGTAAGTAAGSGGSAGSVAATGVSMAAIGGAAAAVGVAAGALWMGYEMYKGFTAGPWEGAVVNGVMTDRYRAAVGMNLSDQDMEMLENMFMDQYIAWTKEQDAAAFQSWLDENDLEVQSIHHLQAYQGAFRAERAGTTVVVNVSSDAIADDQAAATLGETIAAEINDGDYLSGNE